MDELGAKHQKMGNLPVATPSERMILSPPTAINVQETLNKEWGLGAPACLCWFALGQVSIASMAS